MALYENTTSLGALFPKNFHKDLQTLILQIIEQKLGEWRQLCIETQCALPRLQNFDWRIDVKRASESISSISVPSVIVELKISTQDFASPSSSSKDLSSTPSKDSLLSDSSTQIVNFELNKQTLETMIDGLTKIKQQLSTLKWCKILAQEILPNLWKH